MLYYNIHHGFTVSYRALKHLVNGDYTVLIVACQGSILPKPFGAPRPRCKVRGVLAFWFGPWFGPCLLLHYKGNRFNRPHRLSTARSALHSSSTLHYTLLHYLSSVLHYNINCLTCTRVLLRVVCLSVSFASFKSIAKNPQCFQTLTLTYCFC